MKRVSLPALALLAVIILTQPTGAFAFPYFIDFTVKGDRPGQPVDPVNGSLSSFGYFSFDSGLIPPGGGNIWGERVDTDHGTAHLGLGATSLLFTWDSHTWTTRDAELFHIKFDADGNCLAWSIGGEPRGYNVLWGGVYPDFWVQGPGLDFKYVSASAFRAFDGTLLSWRISLGARAFAESKTRTLPVGPNGPGLCLWVEPSEGGFDIRDVDLRSLQLSALQLGSDPINASTSKQILMADRDHNGIPDVGICFAGEDVYRLIGDTVGRRVVPLVVRGQLIDGRYVRAAIDVTIVGTGPALHASVSPNPLNPSGTLSFETRTAGPARVQIFSAAGRLVRTLLDVPGLAAGAHEIPFEGTDGQGRALATGVYYYRVQADGNEARGRVAILK